MRGADGSSEWTELPGSQRRPPLLLGEAAVPEGPLCSPRGGEVLVSMGFSSDGFLGIGTVPADESAPPSCEGPAAREHPTVTVSHPSQAGPEPLRCHTPSACRPGLLLGSKSAGTRAWGAPSIEEPGVGVTGPPSCLRPLTLSRAQV